MQNYPVRSIVPDGSDSVIIIYWVLNALCSVEGSGAVTFVASMFIPLIFDISGGELIVVLLFVLLFFGAKGIPDIARTMGRALRQVRDASNEVQREINKGANDVRRTVEDQRKVFNSDPPATPKSREIPPPPALEQPDEPSAAEGKIES
ncbi:MAG: twin-arginine translocase TatA/TatE family subunit [Flavobacteriales bacterium]|nr:twin-arginine translocase TatA/TatE family subunit [Flavobacteriales bacterium]MBK6943346.1 twin-arginine translocase TatA/TatE family subunit [Flavobacteriales bacterium]MBK7240778.1 twin-arginine translocase TatA/TatE family subunit [Flavobacteriales bacterium]MBK7296605.1 twin-arginine translocase TatA/TatE family subunit [Flavobacteriales bacterium]MBK9536124.1 twin-arginine translocase TatA/TatE family subunit [Flavobacteriales bacterium]